MMAEQMIEQSVEHRALQFECQSCQLLGLLSMPARPRIKVQSRGVLIVTGGPQYRVGSHRQFALLASELAGRGFPVLRFDHRGMGDSEGMPRSFDDIGDDLKAATQQFFEAVPTLQELVIWGLCDGATAAGFHAPDDERICALVLLNPWIRTAPGAARATLRHYYIRRLFDPQFWRKLASGRFSLGASARSLHQLTQAAYSTKTHAAADAYMNTPHRLLDCLQRFQGRILIILSGDDLTAQEFLEVQRHSGAWRTLLAAPHIEQLTIAGANHTFSRRVWRDEVAQMCAKWITSW